MAMTKILDRGSCIDQVYAKWDVFVREVNCKWGVSNSIIQCNRDRAIIINCLRKSVGPILQYHPQC